MLRALLHMKTRFVKEKSRRKKDVYMKKCFLFFALIMANLAHADSMYVGGSIGISALESKKDHQILNGAGVALKSEQHDLGHFGFVGGGFVGYNFDLSCYVDEGYDAGVEFFANGFTTQAQAAHNISSSVTVPSVLKVSQNYNYGVRILPGYWFSDCMEGHLIVGYTRGGFKLTDNGVYGVTSNSFALNGYQVGLGTTFQLSECLAFRLDSVYSGYSNNRNITGIAPTVAQGGPAGAATTNYRLKTSTVDTTISLVYSF